MKDVLRTAWLIITGLSLMTETADTLPWWVYLVWYGAVMGNLLIVRHYFARHDYPKWILRMTKNDGTENENLGK